jgi:hypothetical protein
MAHQTTSSDLSHNLDADKKVGSVQDVYEADDDNIDFRGDDDTQVPKRRQIGVFSAVFIIFNRIIGTGYGNAI